ncbi:MAG: hypothetical protein M3680_12345, partial [Myxococcota bacterium]|nr:hypothetical protein [Myxococcota bacterium]
LTQQAQAAARDGDCLRVALLSVQVGELDRELYGSVFMRDAAVQRCLAPAELPSAEPATTGTSANPSPTPSPIPTP